MNNVRASRLEMDEVSHKDRYSNFHHVSGPEVVHFWDHIDWMGIWGRGPTFRWFLIQRNEKIKIPVTHKKPQNHGFGEIRLFYRLPRSISIVKSDFGIWWIRTWLAVLHCCSQVFYVSISACCRCAKSWKQQTFYLAHNEKQKFSQSCCVIFLTYESHGMSIHRCHLSYESHGMSIHRCHLSCQNTPETLVGIIIVLVVTAVVYCCRGSRRSAQNDARC